MKYRKEEKKVKERKEMGGKKEGRERRKDRTEHIQSLRAEVSHIEKVSALIVK